VTAELRPRLSVSFRTDPGRDPSKQVNEDAVAFEETPVGALAIVCDGMGGHARGAEASQLAIRTVLESLRQADPTGHPGHALKLAIEEAGRRVHGLASAQDRARPGSTLVAFLFHSGGTEVAHCGDSRGYVFRQGTLLPLTRDHSLVRELVDAGQLRPEDAVGHPDSNKITRALGLRPDCGVELRPVSFLQETRDIFLLMSDGVTDVIPDGDLAALAETGLTEGMDALAGRGVHVANARGGPDNTTLLAVHIDAPGLLPDRVAARAQHPLPSDGARGQTQPGDTITDEGLPGDLALESLGLPDGSITQQGRGKTQVLRPEEAPRADPTGPVVAAVEGSPPGESGAHPPLRGGTAKLPIHGPGGGAGGTGAPGDGAGLPPTRGKRVFVGAGIFVVGLIITIVSLIGLQEHDEAPPPLLEAPVAPPG
jgi:PPM family protein phosphatase